MEPLKKIWTEEFPIYWYDTDSNGHLKMSAIANYLQESAWRHANHLGFGYEDALKRKEFWVIITLMIRMVSYPGWGQKITVETWPKGVDRLFAYRDFKIMDSKGTVIGAATSAWMILDQETRRPKNVDIVKPILHLATQQNVLEGNPPLLQPLKTVETSEQRRVRFTEVDQHKHVNNIRFIDWSLDALSSDWHQAHWIRTLVINYLSEVKADDTMLIATGPVSDRSQVIQGVKESDGKIVFRTRLDWEIGGLV
jgi:medium-chain acyl-[acyl-carrier-protein] hydrolase